MKNTVVKYALLISFLVQVSLFAQAPYKINCGQSVVLSSGDSPLGQGYRKPMETLPHTDPNVFFRVLIVYVEFKNDTTGSDDYWAPGEKPEFADSLLSPQKQLGINAYQSHYISNYFNRVSRDRFDMIGNVKHIILPNEYSYYSGSTSCYSEALIHTMAMLDTSVNPNDRVNWSDYDLWTYNFTTEEYENIPDGSIDMIYVQFRRAEMCGIISGGHGALYVEYNTINGGFEINGCAICYFGSGFIGINGWKMNLPSAIGFFRHEYCHYTLGNHRPYSTILGGDGTETICGSELGFSPQDLISVGLADVIGYNQYICAG
jgi:hypothetical protein